MATETVDSSAHKKVPGASLPPRNNAGSSPPDANENDKQMGTSVRPPPPRQPQHQRRLSPFIITGRPEEKHLGISARNLAVSDFALLRTLGTGELDRVLCCEKSLTAGFLSVQELLLECG